MPLDVLFRADASVDIGIGHVMRCLTLADALRDAGARPRFVCRDLPGHLAQRIADHRHPVTLLPVSEGTTRPASPPPHAAWLPVSQAEDAAQTRATGPDPDWIVVDHYALDERWERAAAGQDTQVMVIDDLVDRPHAADLLLDQTLNRTAAEYAALAPNARVLSGAQYALLRPEFAATRHQSLGRNRYPPRNYLVSLGGIDSANATERVLTAMSTIDLPADAFVSVIMGSAAPHLEAVKARAATLPFKAEVVVDVDDMADRMAQTDFSIGAAGSTTWERCCLGVPSLVVVLADNQQNIADMIDACGAAQNIGALSNPKFQERLVQALQRCLKQPDVFAQMAKSAAQVTDGTGARKVVENLMDVRKN